MSKPNPGNNRNISIFNIILLLLLLGALSSIPYIVDKEHLGIFIASFLGAFGGGYALYVMSYIRKFRSDYDEINYTISLVSLHTENVINFYKSFLEVRIESLKDIYGDVESHDSAAQFLASLSNTKLIIPESAVSRAKNQIKESQKLSLQVFYNKFLTENMSNDVNHHKLRFTMYQSPDLIRVLTKLSQNLNRFNVFKDEINSFIEKDSRGQTMVEMHLTKEELDDKLKQLEEQNVNLEKSLKSILFFGETLGIKLLENYIKNYSWITRKLLGTMGSGYRLIAVMNDDEYKKYVPDLSYIPGYEDVLSQKSGWSIRF